MIFTRQYLGDKYAREFSTCPRSRFGVSDLGGGIFPDGPRLSQKFVFGRASQHAHRC
jgi:hypothetical protein